MPLRVATRLYTLALAAALATPAHADPIEDFYKDRTLTLIAGYSAGGGFDLYARIMANHLGKHIPGHPRIIVQNMPGAGSTNASNYLYNVSPKDGSVIALIPGTRHRAASRGNRRLKLRFDQVHLARKHKPANSELI